MTPPARLLAFVCLVTACWIGSVAQVHACSCSSSGTLEARDASFAVFEGTVVDRRIILVPNTPPWLPVPEQEIIVRRVWKGVTTERVFVLYMNGGMCSGDVPVGTTALFFLMNHYGRLLYHLCSPNREITGAAEALAKLGPPIATFGERSPEPIAVAKTLPVSRRIRAYMVVGIAHYTNALFFLSFYPPLQWDRGLLLGAVLLLVVLAGIFVMKRQRRRSLLLFAASATTLIMLLAWTGHDLTSDRIWRGLLDWP